MSFSYLKSLFEVEWSEQKSGPAAIRKGQKEKKKENAKSRRELLVA